VASGAPSTRPDLQHVAPDERPTAADYGRYVALAEAYRDRGYRDADALPEHRFVVVDPLFNALLCWSEEALADIAGVIGEPVEPHRRRAAQLRDAMLEHLYDPAAGQFFALSGSGGADRSVERTVGGLVPLLLDLPAEVVDAVVGSAVGPRFALSDRVPLPSYDLTGHAFDTTRYWRGPAWVNMSWLVLRGLQRHGRWAQAETVRAALLAVVRAGGFREYFDPLSGVGRGCTDFSWSAALTLDLLAGDRP
jgi:glycogen debranching enzyme